MENLSILFIQLGYSTLRQVLRNQKIPIIGHMENMLHDVFNYLRQIH